MRLSFREQKINREVQRFDPDLFLEVNYKGIPQVLRKKYALKVYDVDGQALLVSERADQYIFALTDNWRPTGEVVEWGVIPIIQKLISIDTWKEDSESARLETHNEKVDKSIERDFANKTEDFAYEWRDSFKETFKDINTSNLKKLDKRRIKDGNRK